jgi:predicted kinase
MCGFPGGGKSTWAKKQVQENGAVIVSKDAIRTMMHGEYVFDKNREPFVKELVDALMSGCCQLGVDIIVDETNITKSKRAALIHYAENNTLEPVIVWCRGNGKHLENRMKEPRGYTEDKWREVIDGMVVNFEPPTDGECVVITV